MGDREYPSAVIEHPYSVEGCVEV